MGEGLHCLWEPSPAMARPVLPEDQRAAPHLALWPLQLPK